MYKYIYENKKTGQKIRTNHEVIKDGFVLVKELKDTKIKSSDVIKKGKK